MEEIQVEENLEKLSNPMPNMRDPRQPFYYFINNIIDGISHFSMALL